LLIGGPKLHLALQKVRDRINHVEVRWTCHGNAQSLSLRKYWQDVVLQCQMSGNAAEQLRREMHSRQIDPLASPTHEVFDAHMLTPNAGDHR
jgi:hypothetical protein